MRLPPHPFPKSRLVKSDWHRTRGEVIEWEPLSAAMCDTLVRDENGRECWYGSGDLKPDDGWGPLPSRAEAREQARTKAATQLEAMRAQLIAEWHKPWPGAEHGKALVGMMIDGAIADLKGE